jgi:hypothetical protein
MPFLRVSIGRKTCRRGCCQPSKYKFKGDITNKALWFRIETFKQGIVSWSQRQAGKRNVDC